LTVKLIAVGDIMLGDHPVCIGHGVRSKVEKYGFDYPFTQIGSLIKTSDIAIGNLECALSDIGYDIYKLEKSELRGSPFSAVSLKNAGFDVLSIANNHTLQHGSDVFWDTVENLNRNKLFALGLNYSGNESNVFSFYKENVKIAIISYSFRLEKHYRGKIPYAIGNEEIVCRQIRKLAYDFDIIILSLHWGSEYLNYPSYEQIMMGHKFIEAGVHLVIGHHPHVLQGVEKYKHGYIAYSLGNFVFDKWQNNARETIILEALITKHGVKEIKIHPVYINNEYQPCFPDNKKSNEINNKIQEYSNKIQLIICGNKNFMTHNYHRKEKLAYLKFRIESYLYFLLHINKYSSSMLRQSLERFLQRRMEEGTGI